MVKNAQVHRFGPAEAAGLLLCFLLAHLLFMVSPVHAAMVGLEMDAPAPAGLESDLPLPALLSVQGPQSHHGSHCAVEWNEPGNLATALSPAVGPAWSRISHANGFVSRPRLPQAPEAPHGANSQALLQVFRI